MTNLFALLQETQANPVAVHKGKATITSRHHMST